MGDGNEALTGSAGLYVDVENLPADGQSMVQSLIGNWPERVPKLTRLSLYVRADHVELWKLWATSRFPELDVVVHGTQHFSMSASKNSADMAMATNAMADLVLHRVSHVVVFSDDSDFISLYVAIRNEPGIPLPDGRVPFLWVITDRENSVSSTVKQYFPPEQLHLVNSHSRNYVEASPDGEPLSRGKSPSPPKPSKGTWVEMARAVVEQMEVGLFKSTDCQRIIAEGWPKHPLASAGGASFGTEFRNNIWPVLEGLGVKISSPGRKPIRYEMTEKAKTA